MEYRHCSCFSCRRGPWPHGELHKVKVKVDNGKTGTVLVKDVTDQEEMKVSFQWRYGFWPTTIEVVK